MFGYMVYSLNKYGDVIEDATKATYRVAYDGNDRRKD
jgi:hypothetical protein